MDTVLLLIAFAFVAITIVVVLGEARYFDFGLLTRATLTSHRTWRSLAAPLGTCLWLSMVLMLQVIHHCAFAMDEILFRRYRRVSIKEPLFVFGAARSGTTLTHRLLASDEQFTSMKLWELVLAPAIVEKYLLWMLGYLDTLLGSPGNWLITRAEKLFYRTRSNVHHYSLFVHEEDDHLLIHIFASSLLGAQPAESRVERSGAI